MNSRLRISNQLDLVRQAQICRTQAADRGTRAFLVVISPPEGWLEQFAQLCQCELLPCDSNIDRADRISAYLGSERYVAIVQTGPRPDLGLIAAVAGTIKAGGILIIGTSGSPEQLPINDHNGEKTSAPPASSHSIQRFENLAALTALAFPDTVRCIEIQPQGGKAAFATQADRIEMPDDDSYKPRSTAFNTHAFAEQNRLLAQASKHLADHDDSCIVIKGRRGRGKSSLLARLALHLSDIGIDFRITALHESALSAFHQHASQLAKHYLSPESACTASVDVLLVDEAASLSFKQLQRFLTHFKQLVFCTTIDGYEASGRAFDVRMLSDWAHTSKPLLQLEAKQPWRWAKNDALEHFTDHLLLNKVVVPQHQLIRYPRDRAKAHAAQCQLTHVSQHELTGDENLLASVHSLLHSTHYQTTTKDLEHLLDAPTVQLWIQKLDEAVVGVLVLEREGDIPACLHDAILARKRRLPNQLLPQLLAQTANQSDALGKRYVRILRLAVNSDLRRQKLASRLVQTVTAEYLRPHTLSGHTQTQPGVDAIGASFAADDCSLGFWRSLGFIEFHRGFRANPRTGKRAVAIMQSFEPLLSDTLFTASDIHRDNELARQSAVVASPPPATSSPKAERDRQLLQRFAAGQRSYHDTYASLRRLSNQIDLSLVQQAGQSVRQYELELRNHVQLWLDIQSS
ncbi:MAG: GNAT family N-acetyltransferase [Granulosicoccus sp.]